jgi:hypothetical protein
MMSPDNTVVIFFSFLASSRKAAILFEKAQQRKKAHTIRPIYDKDSNDDKRSAKSPPAPRRDMRVSTNEKSVFRTGGSNNMTHNIAPAIKSAISNARTFLDSHIRVTNSSGVSLGFMCPSCCLTALSPCDTVAAVWPQGTQGTIIANNIAPMSCIPLVLHTGTGHGSFIANHCLLCPLYP